MNCHVSRRCFAPSESFRLHLHFATTLRIVKTLWFPRMRFASVCILAEFPEFPLRVRLFARPIWNRFSASAEVKIEIDFESIKRPTKRRGGLNFTAEFVLKQQQQLSNNSNLLCPFAGDRSPIDRRKRIDRLSTREVIPPSAALADSNRLKIHHLNLMT